MKYITRPILAIVVLLFLVGVVLRNPVIAFSNEKLKASGSSMLLRDHVEFITQVKPVRNFRNIESLNKVADYIKIHFEKNCDQINFQKYMVGELEYKNVICFIEGHSRERIVIGAHYDVSDVEHHDGSMPESPVGQDGADDNASGVAGILELTRLIKENGKKPNHDLEIIAYSLEEPPYFRTEKMGSYIHAKALKDNKVKVKFMITVEMIGYYSDEWGSQNYPLGLLKLFDPLQANFVTLIGGVKEYWPMRELKSLMASSTSLPVYSLNAPSFVRGVDFSDHLNYWAMGYDGYMLTDTSFYRNKNYHQVTDTAETLNYEKMADLINGLYNLSINVKN